MMTRAHTNDLPSKLRHLLHFLYLQRFLAGLLVLLPFYTAHSAEDMILPQTASVPQLQEKDHLSNQNTDSNLNYGHTAFPSSFYSFDPSAQNTAIFVNKETHILSVFRSRSDGLYEFYKSYPAITGKSKGDKQNSGDLKTPEGIYIIDGKKEKKFLEKKYGAGAWTLNYPNPFDLLKHKTGFGIWLHGVESDDRIVRLRDTEGCVALRNEDWHDLEPYIRIGQTPIAIAKHSYLFQGRDKIDSQKNFVEDFMSQWKHSWEQGNFDFYSDLYSQEFASKKMSKQKWIARKKYFFERRKNIKINPTHIRFFELNDELVILFDQEYISDEKKDLGSKTLFLKRGPQGFKIISEVWLPKN